MFIHNFVIDFRQSIEVHIFEHKRKRRSKIYIFFCRNEIKSAYYKKNYSDDSSDDSDFFEQPCGSNNPAVITPDLANRLAADKAYIIHLNIFYMKILL